MKRGNRERRRNDKESLRGGFYICVCVRTCVHVCVCSCQLFNERPLLISELILSCSTRLNSGRRWEEVTDEGGREQDEMEMKAWTFVLLAAPELSQFLDLKHEVMVILNSRFFCLPGVKCVVSSTRMEGEERR